MCRFLSSVVDGGRGEPVLETPQLPPKETAMKTVASANYCIESPT